MFIIDMISAGTSPYHPHVVTTIIVVIASFAIMPDIITTSSVQGHLTITLHTPH
jgi:hypothetical protein